MALFEKGKSGNPLGRRKTPEWKKIEYWFKMLQNDLKHERLHPRDKVHADLECIKLILGKNPLNPKTAEQSASNAKDALNLLKSLEDKDNGSNSCSTPDSRKDGMDDRRPDVQAVKDTKIDEGGLGSEQGPQ